MFSICYLISLARSFALAKTQSIFSASSFRYIFVCNFLIFIVCVCVCVCESLLNSILIAALVFVAKVGHSAAGRQFAVAWFGHKMCNTKVSLLLAYEVKFIAA